MSFWCHRFDQNSNKNIVRISALKFFVASWGLPGSFLGLPGDLVSNIINKEAYRKPQKASRKPQGSYKNFQGRNPYNIFVAILVETMTPKRHFEINWSLRKNYKGSWRSMNTTHSHQRKWPFNSSFQNMNLNAKLRHCSFGLG